MKASVKAKAEKHNAEFMKAYSELADPIFRHCYFRVYDKERARELMQESFMKTWQYLLKGKEIKNMKAFLYRVANNLIIDLSRKKKESSLDDLMEDGFDPGFSDEDKIIAQVDVQQIKPFLDKIEPMYREAVLMRYIDDLSPREISQVIGESENVVSVRIYRGIKQIKQLLQDEQIV